MSCGGGEGWVGFGGWARGCGGWSIGVIYAMVAIVSVVVRFCSCGRELRYYIIL